MTARGFLWLLAAFIGCLTLAGAAYWPIPYAQADVAALWNPSLIVILTSAALLVATQTASGRHTATVMTLVLPVTVLARVLAETSTDPTSHNLWPLEIVLALILGGSCALVGIVAGTILRRLAGEPNAGSQ